MTVAATGAAGLVLNAALEIRPFFGDWQLIRIASPVCVKVYSLLLRIADMTCGLRRPCITARTHSGFSSGA